MALIAMAAFLVILSLFAGPWVLVLIIAGALVALYFGR